MKNVAIIIGGFSNEKEISIKSGDMVYKNLDKEKYKPYLIHILREGWFFIDENANKIDIDRNDFSLKINGEKIVFDIAFNTIHGSPGEDGKLQGYFEITNIPYTGCDVLTSALTFNKKMCLSILELNGIIKAKNLISYRDRPVEKNDILSELELPIFIKPNKSGSSLGASKVEKQADIDKAIELAFKEDDQILIEEYIDGKEVSVGVFSTNNEVKVLSITEIRSDESFFNYKAKYDGASTEITPADLPKDLASKIKAEAKKIYQILSLRSYIRIDFIIKDEVPYFLEVNATPGLSENSIIPAQIMAYGIEWKDFFSEIIEDIFKNK
ncbi:D-alanine--D-alanine ligase [Ichthyobacterium seriolicida]|uniref:D-alanine--D-alanine ligase n=1 Tax=Ichthyobacterium seriolicida TaxID=242600 RepID=A0A1J1DYN5_9FLAO|nr:D-alanine--D-alanine ligase [Ichthyobacterium seriolicida]BAV95023.1 D-alanine--D-alanine ligase [Ichthyobacterium seriolicida]